jgi:vacuolar-type H+-ATPase subunit E/Vma4
MNAKFLKKASAEIERKTDIGTVLTLSSTSIKCVGGVIVSKLEGEASVNNTFEEKLDRLKEKESIELETILF